MGQGIISKIFGWVEHPSIDTDKTPTDWVLGLVLVLLVSFLWTRVVKQTL